MKYRSLVYVMLLVVFAAGCTLDPNAAKKKYVDKGNKYFERGKYKEALIMYRNALKKDAKYGEAYYRAALAEVRLLQYPQAARDLHRAIELQPDNMDAHTRLINIYLNAYLGDRRRPKQFLNELRQLGDKIQKRDPNAYELIRLNGFLALTDNKLEDAIKWFEKAHQAKPYQADVIQVYMQTLAASGRKEEAEKLGYEMIKRVPQTTTIYDTLYVQYLRDKKLDEAENVLKQKTANNPKALSHYLQLAAHYYSVQKRSEMQATLQKLTQNTKDFPDAHQSVGDFYLRIRDIDSAIQNYQEGLKQTPSRRQMYRKRIIEAKVLQDKKDEAQQLLTEVLEEDPKDAEGIAIRASLSMLTGTREQVQNAINDLQTVVSRMPENPVVRFNLGRAHMTRGNWQQAKVQFEEAIKLRPDYLLPRIALAQINTQNGEWGKVVQMAQEILVYDAMNVPARLLRTRALIGMGESKQARLELDQLIQQLPNVWEARLQLAALDLAEKNFKAAEDIFRKMYAATNDPRALLGLTETYVAQNNFKPAIDLLEGELSRKPERLDYRIALGNINVRSGDLKLAAAHYQKVIDKNPRSADAWMRLGEVQRRQGNSEGAKSAFTKAKDLAPTNIVPVLQLAILYDGAGQRDQAKPLYEQTLKLQPDNGIALNNLAYLLAENGTDLDQALTLAQRAKQKMPTDPSVSDTLGWIYIKKNLADSAISIFKELVEKNPDRSTFHYHLAMALLQKGDKPSAKRALDLALQRKPKPDEEKKIRELIARIG